MNKLAFSTNRPVTVRLHAIEGKERESQFGGNQHLFSAEEGVFYVSEAAGRAITDQLKKLSVQPGDPVEICKAEVDQGRGRKSVMWQVMVPGTQEPAPAPAPVPARRPVATMPAPERTALQDAPERPRWAEVLAVNTCVLVDVYSAVLKHANEQQAGIRPDDVRALLTTMFIQYAQKGGITSAA